MMCNELVEEVAADPLLDLNQITYDDEKDKQFMQMTLREAGGAQDAGDYLVGAGLTVDGELWGSARNSLFTDAGWMAHAEHNLLSAIQKGYAPESATDQPLSTKLRLVEC